MNVERMFKSSLACMVNIKKKKHVNFLQLLKFLGLLASSHLM